MFMAMPTFMASSCLLDGIVRPAVKGGKRFRRPDTPTGERLGRPSAAALASGHESLRLRPARLWREPRPYQAGHRAALSLEPETLQGGRRRAHLCRASPG